MQSNIGQEPDGQYGEQLREYGQNPGKKVKETLCKAMIIETYLRAV